MCKAYQFLSNHNLAFTIGYPINERMEYLRSIAAGKVGSGEICSFAKNEGLRYLALHKQEEKFLGTVINQKFFTDNFVRIADTPEYLIYVIYDFKSSCVNLN